MYDLKRCNHRVLYSMQNRHILLSLIFVVLLQGGFHLLEHRGWQNLKVVL